MKLRSLGEFGFIDKIARRTPKLSSAILGIGDDAAVLPYTDDKYLLITMDMLVEGVHFDLTKFSAFKMGRKALASSLSDIAAMAGVPKYCLVSLAVPPDTPVSLLDDFYAGLLKLASEFGVELVGGDTNKSEKLIFDVCVVGEVEKDRLVTRSGAKVGDSIFVTGSLGGSIKGRQYDFVPRIREARALALNFKINSMIDISDGLALDLQHITDSSHTGALIYDECIPMSRDAASRQDALSGGEDFELLFTAPSSVTEDQLARGLGIPVTKIGQIVPKAAGVRIVRKKGAKRQLKRTGYRHF